MRHRSTSYCLAFDVSRDSTQLQFQATSKLELLSTLSSSRSKAGRDGNPASPAKEDADLHSSTYNGSDAYTLNDFNTEGGIPDKECSDIEIKYIWLPKLKQEICQADLTGDQVFLCCIFPPAVPVDQMQSMQDKNNTDSELNQVPHKFPTQIHEWVRLYDRERAKFGELPPR